MPSATITEIIQMYSKGMISRESLEQEILSVERADGPAHEGFDGPEAGDCLVLYPDQNGIWRLPA